MRQAIIGFFTLQVLLGACVPMPPEAYLERGLEAFKRGDFGRAQEDLRYLAEQGHTVAQYHLGRLLAENGAGPRDLAMAATWYRRAAQAGHAKAQFVLGQMYHYGTGIHPDVSAAAKWYRRSAEQGVVEAQLELAVLMIRGQGTPNDLGGAYTWLTLASRAAGATQRQTALHYRDLIASFMTAEEIARAEGEADAFIATGQ